MLRCLCLITALLGLTSALPSSPALQTKQQPDGSHVVYMSEIGHVRVSNELSGPELYQDPGRDVACVRKCQAQYGCHHNEKTYNGCIEKYCGSSEIHEAVWYRDQICGQNLWQKMMSGTEQPQFAASPPEKAELPECAISCLRDNGCHLLKRPGWRHCVNNACMTSEAGLARQYRNDICGKVSEKRDDTRNVLESRQQFDYATQNFPEHPTNSDSDYSTDDLFGEQMSDDEQDDQGDQDDQDGQDDDDDQDGQDDQDNQVDQGTGSEDSDLDPSQCLQVCSVSAAMKISGTLCDDGTLSCYCGESVYLELAAECAQTNCPDSQMPVTATISQDVCSEQKSVIMDSEGQITMGQSYSTEQDTDDARTMPDMNDNEESISFLLGFDRDGDGTADRFAGVCYDEYDHCEKLTTELAMARLVELLRGKLENGSWSNYSKRDSALLSAYHWSRFNDEVSFLQHDVSRPKPKHILPRAAIDSRYGFGWPRDTADHQESKRQGVTELISPPGGIPDGASRDHARLFTFMAIKAADISPGKLGKRSMASADRVANNLAPMITQEISLPDNKVTAAPRDASVPVVTLVRTLTLHEPGQRDVQRSGQTDRDLSDHAALEERADSLPQVCPSPSLLNLTLANGVLTDSRNGRGYIAGNRQFQFDNPPQSGSIYTAGFSIDGGFLALGPSKLFYHCASTDKFGNLYDQSIASYCEPVFLKVFDINQDCGATRGTEGQQAKEEHTTEAKDLVMQVAQEVASPATATYAVSLTYLAPASGNTNWHSGLENGVERRSSPGMDIVLASLMVFEALCWRLFA